MLYNDKIIKNMEQNNCLVKVQEIFRDVLDNEDIVLDMQTTADDIEEWDSLSHIQLIVAIEKEFKIKFTSREILSWNNVGEMIEAILHKCFYYKTYLKKGENTNRLLS